MVTGPEGDAYSCGLCSNGQLGIGNRQNVTAPTLITLGKPPDPNPPDLGTPVDPVDKGAGAKGVGPRYRLRRLFTGGDQTFATLVITERGGVRREGGREGGGEGRGGVKREGGGGGREEGCDIVVITGT